MKIYKILKNSHQTIKVMANEIQTRIKVHYSKKIVKIKLTQKKIALSYRMATLTFILNKIIIILNNNKIQFQNPKLNKFTFLLKNHNNK